MLWREPSEVERRVASEPVRLKSVALPVEHGGWGLLGEPLLLGLLMAPSWAGLGVALMGLGAFLARHPLKLAVADWRARRRVARTAAAERFVLLYGALAAAGLGLATGGRPGWWLPLLAAAPFALIQFGYDALRQGRQLLPELLGSVALSALVAAELIAAGWPPVPALTVWAVVAAKALGAVLYVRTRLRCERGAAPDRTAALGSHAAALACALALAAAGRLPWLVAVGCALLMARAAHGLSRYRRPARPQAVGIQELAFGVAFVLLVALGYAAGS